MDKVVQKFAAKMLSLALGTAWMIPATLVAITPPTHAMQIDLTDESEDGEVKVNFDYLIANGEMNQRDPGVIRQILSRRAKQGKRTVILFTSHGGYLEMTQDLAEAIIQPSNDLYKQHKLSNVFVVNEECSSACGALTALLTSKRNPQSLLFFVASKAKFGFHSPVDKVKGKVASIKNKADREAAIKKQIDFLEKAGVSGDWLTANTAYFRQEKLTELKAKRLCDERTMIIPPDSCLPESVEDLVTHIDSLMAGPDSSLKIPSPDANQPQKKSAELK